MGSSAAFPASPAFQRVFRAHAEGEPRMNFAEFMRLALYDSEVGYYRRDRKRVGYGGSTDFFTSATSGPVFGEMIVAASVALLRGNDPRRFTFVEIGAEPDGGVLRDVAHPFADARTLRLGEPLEIRGRCVVFSNELFDAQPFRRFRFRNSRWLELGVELAEGELREVEFVPADLPGVLPPAAPEGWTIDAPLDSAGLAARIVGQPWHGLFVAADYGKSWRELLEATPAGTARAYSRHRQRNELLADAGEQDLTCHVCWDWIADALAAAGFDKPSLESQERFLIQHAAAYLEPAIAADAATLSRRKLSLMQLLHPAHLGQKFQVLHAWRAEKPA